MNIEYVLFGQFCWVWAALVRVRISLGIDFQHYSLFHHLVPDVENRHPEQYSNSRDQYLQYLEATFRLIEKYIPLKKKYSVC